MYQIKSLSAWKYIMALNTNTICLNKKKICPHIVPFFHHPNAVLVDSVLCLMWKSSFLHCCHCSLSCVNMINVSNSVMEVQAIKILSMTHSGFLYYSVA